MAASKLSHASNRLEERYGDLDFQKLSNHILKGRHFKILESDELGAICQTKFARQKVYFVLHERYRGEEIATFLTKKMADDAVIDKQMRREM